MGRKYARFSIRRGELGWSGTKGGRTAQFEFWDGERKVGTLQVSEAALRWKSPYTRRWRRISVAHLDDLFGTS